jgi:hypothetical protein
MRARLSSSAVFNVILAMWLSGSAVPATAIVMRHDRAQQQFRDLAGGFPTTAVLLSGEFTPRLRGTGTLIAPYWILTAAHVAAHVAVGDVAEVSGKTVMVDRVILHRDWHHDTDLKSDIALVHLKSPMTHVAPANLYTGTDEAGMFVTFVGPGSIGTGLSGDTRRADRQLRGATNRVEKADTPFLQFRFDAPEDASATDLEGISGKGDSGGPAYIERAGKLYVIGVSSWQDTKPANRQEGRYGVLEYYIRVSDFIAWITSTMQTQQQSP